MDEWNELTIVIAAGAGAILLLLLIWLVVLTSKFNKLSAAHRKLLGETGVNNMEDVMHILHERLNTLDQSQKSHASRVDEHQRRLSSLKGRIGVHRFNAFSDSGSDLSFSIAIVNEEQDGVTITGIHGREQTFLYAKPIDKGQSAYMLTPEEKIAINQALQKG
jgi:uncharacterized protein YlxW (UPF0749 family)